MKIINEDGTINGAFINAFITLSYLGAIITGLFYNPVADQIIKLQNFMTWFFGISFTVWSAKKTIEFTMGDKSFKMSDKA